MINSSKAIILLYHRVINTGYDPYKLAVKPSNFFAQMKFLKRNYNLISFDELVYSLKRRRVSNKSVVITFDDGYVDNYLYAKPILEKLKIPATFFIISSYINSSKLFWWDRLARIFHPKRQLSFLNLKINNFNFTFELSNSFKKDQVFRSIHGLLKYLSPRVIERSVSYLEQWAKLATAKNSLCRAMNEDELKGMAKNGLFRVGAHAHRHSQLSQQTAAFQSVEIGQCKHKLEKIIQMPVTLFSYPYGAKKDYDMQTIRILKKCEFEAACSTTAGMIECGNSLYELPRLDLSNASPSRLKKFLSRLFS